MNRLLCLLSTAFFFLAMGCHASHGEGEAVIDTPGLPYFFELSTGQTHEFERGNQKHILELKSVSLETEPYLGRNFSGTYYRGEVAIVLDGQEHTLLHGPYRLPVVIGNLRLYVEAIEGWESGATVYRDQALKGEVRLSVEQAERSWLAETILWPIPGYRWRASSYNNTSSGLVPFVGNLYYHHGEDYGAIPDLLDVLSPFDGEVVASPLPDGDGDSNTLSIRRSDGLTAIFCHMNIETIPPGLLKGASVTRGEAIGKTGCTWNGKRGQQYDPHLHIEFYLN